MKQKTTPPPIDREEKTVVYATKLSPWFAQVVNEAVQAVGVTRYEAGQKGLEAWVMTNSPMLRCPPEVMHLLRAYQMQPGMKEAFSLADPSADPYIFGALYFLRADGKGGERCLYVGDAFFGEFKVDFNPDRITDRVIKALVPTVYDSLMEIGRDEECTTTLEVIDILCRQWHDRNDVLHDGFDDNKRSDFGRPIDYTKFNRKLKRDIDSPSLFPETFNNNDE